MKTTTTRFLDEQPRAMLSRRVALAVALFGLASMVASAQAAMIPPGHALIPAGLGPGDSFQIIFTTSTTTPATNGTIGYYDSFVNTNADSFGFGPSSTIPISWAAVVTVVDGTQAPSHAVQSHDVYDANGGLFRTFSEGLYTGASTSPPDDNIETLGGAPVIGNPYTGIRPEDFTLLTRALGLVSNVRFGNSQSATTGWYSQSSGDPSFSHQIYGLSESLTVAVVVVPEPSTLTLAALGFLALIRRRRRK